MAVFVLLVLIFVVNTARAKVELPHKLKVMLVQSMDSKCTIVFEVFWKDLLRELVGGQS